MKIAKLVKVFDMSKTMKMYGGRREAKLYQVDFETIRFIRCSAVDEPGLQILETYLFEADAEGNVLNWTEMDGSVQGYADVDRCMREAGFEVVEAIS